MVYIFAYGKLLLTQEWYNYVQSQQVPRGMDGATAFHIIIAIAISEADVDANKKPMSHDSEEHGGRLLQHVLYCDVRIDYSDNDIHNIHVLTAKYTYMYTSDGQVSN